MTAGTEDKHEFCVCLSASRPTCRAQGSLLLLACDDPATVNNVI
jgi:hypothetical protein